MVDSSQRYLIFFYSFMVVNHAQVIQFLNLTHLSSDPMNEGVYECISLTSSDILSLVWKYTDLFYKKSINAFSNGVSTKQPSQLLT